MMLVNKPGPIVTSREVRWG